MVYINIASVPPIFPGNVDVMLELNLCCRHLQMTLRLSRRGLKTLSLQIAFSMSSAPFAAGCGGAGDGPDDSDNNSSDSKASDYGSDEDQSGSSSVRSDYDNDTVNNAPPADYNDTFVWYD